MDGKKMIRNAIIAFLLVGILGLGISIYAEALGYKGSVFESMFASDSSSDQLDESTEENTEEELLADDSKESVTTEDETLEETKAEPSVVDEVTVDESADPKEDETTLTDDTDTEVLDDESGTESEADVLTSEENPALREGPFYQYRITADFGLNMYDDPDVPTGQGNIIGVIPAGTTGYAIAQGNRRTLVDYNGKLGYVSNTYTSLTEVSAEEYPEELKSITWENASVGDKGGAE